MEELDYLKMIDSPTVVLLIDKNGFVDCVKSGLEETERG